MKVYCMAKSPKFISKTIPINITSTTNHTHTHIYTHHHGLTCNTLLLYSHNIKIVLKMLVPHPICTHCIYVCENDMIGFGIFIIFQTPTAISVPSLHHHRILYVPIPNYIYINGGLKRTKGNCKQFFVSHKFYAKKKKKRSI